MPFFQDRQTQTGDGPAEHLPRPPLTKAQKARIAAAITGITLGLTATIVISVVIPGLGFAAGGIVAGSVAASSMSSAAIASGGGVAAGSTVAVLQAIGAGGAATAASAAAGTTAGALTVSQIVEGVIRFKKGRKDVSTSEAEIVEGVIRFKKRRKDVSTSEAETQTDSD
ncbi:interferon alpha-inducible protein 27, mitochondrial-like [Lytechinus variegatus]|uniref:interferon alpha-inducible protein 27, mitochondrial-like n=1 Tax=Lytechinus variegatus TaxID=7654 RepID=UPI001BB1C5EA|nr:interferon alpha-inducible protein 27, mitochondrial-like [Lytechinus variegatus]